MAWPSKLVFVRHAESEGNLRSADERAEYDVASHAYDLTPRGKQQARITGEYLKERFGCFDTYYVSYYARRDKRWSLSAQVAKSMKIRDWQKLSAESGTR
jgi:broad specificity phosphatase PhoE